MSAPSTSPDGREHTKWSPALLGFYASCAGVSLGACVGFSAYKFFGSTTGLVFGLSLAAISCVTCYLSLNAARRPPEPKAPSGTK
jgi:amino acid permease